MSTWEAPQLISDSQKNGISSLEGLLLGDFVAWWTWPKGFITLYICTLFFFPVLLATELRAKQCVPEVHTSLVPDAPVAVYFSFLLWPQLLLSNKV